MQILKRYTRLILQRKKRMKENEAYDNLFIKKKNLLVCILFGIAIQFLFSILWYLRWVSMNLFVFHLKHCRLLLQFTLLFCHDFIQILGIIWQYKICRTKKYVSLYPSSFLTTCQQFMLLV